MANFLQIPTLEHTIATLEQRQGQVRVSLVSLNSDPSSVYIKVFQIIIILSIIMFDTIILSPSMNNLWKCLDLLNKFHDIKG